MIKEGWGHALCIRHCTCSVIPIKLSAQWERAEKDVDKKRETCRARKANKSLKHWPNQSGNIQWPLGTSQEKTTFFPLSSLMARDSKKWEGNKSKRGGWTSDGCSSMCQFSCHAECLFTHSECTPAAGASALTGDRRYLLFTHLRRERLGVVWTLEDGLLTWYRRNTATPLCTKIDPPQDRFSCSPSCWPVIQKERHDGCIPCTIRSYSHWSVY